MASSAEGEEHRRSQLERLTFFSDAVFAIAITLLVIEVRVPELEHASDGTLGQALANLVPQYVGFLSSFLVIGRFWVSHHEMFGMLKASDSRLVWANLFFLLAIAFMPFPTAVLSRYVQLRVGVGFYTFWLTVLGLLNARLAQVALKDRRLVREEVGDAAITARRRASAIAILIGATSFAAGMVTPLLALVALAVGSPLITWVVRRGSPKTA